MIFYIMHCALNKNPIPQENIMAHLTVYLFFLGHALLTCAFDFIPDSGTYLLPDSPAPTPSPSPANAPTPAAYDPGLAEYKETHSDTMYDVVPLYQCNSTGIGYSVSEWYGICKNQCSYSTPKIRWNVSLFEYQNFVATLPVFATTVVSTSKTSHVSLFGTCLTYVSDTHALVMNYTSFVSKINLLLNNTSLRPGSTTVLDKSITPDCSYWADNTASGNIYTMDTDVWSLTVSISGDLLVKNPYSLEYTPYNESAVYFNGKWFFWDSTYNHQTPQCALIYSGDDSCKLNPNIGVLSCDASGVVINLNGATTFNNTCVGNINISSNSIPFRVIQTLEHPPEREKLTSLLGSSYPSYTGITDLFKTVSDTIDTLEKNYCSSLCDLSDRSFQTIIDDEDVVDTPNGPWLPVQDQGIIRLIPCSVDINWVISIPLTICLRKNTLKISRLGSSDVHWWDPSLTYFDPQMSCDHSETNAYDPLIKRRMSINMTFWRGTAQLDYPYSGPVRWIPRGNPNSIRSSKWFPQIKNISDHAGLTMSILGATITQSISKSVNISDGDNYIEYSSNQLSFFAAKIWTDICLATRGIWNFFTGVIGYGKTILITAVAVYLGGILLQILLRPRRSPSWADM
ncbi:glycoprotein [Babaco nucleorhabdovirus 1]|uniref:Glycoprotein n=1 Tax=Babaco nucleorhabdovirus 1 TaxID=3053260 RepID=A0A9Y1YRY5_9RHAB|nr:glycoprotein [Babaco nucleorhabdovirus 1]